MDGFLTTFNPATSDELLGQKERVRQLRRMFNSQGIGIGRSISEKKWMKELVRLDSKYDDFAQVFDWLIDNYSKIWFLPTAIQSPTAIWKKYDKLRKWMESTNKTIYEIRDNDEMESVYAYYGNLHAEDFDLWGIEAKEHAFVMFEFVEFIREISKKVSDRHALASKHEADVLNTLIEYMEAVPIINEYLCRVYKDLEDWMNSGKMEATRLCKTNLVPRKGNKKCFGYIKWIMGVKLKNRFHKTTKANVYSILNEIYEKETS